MTIFSDDLWLIFELVLQALEVVFILRSCLEHYVLKPNLDNSLSSSLLACFHAKYVLDILIWPIFTQKLFGKRGRLGVCVSFWKKKKEKRRRHGQSDKMLKGWKLKWSDPCVFIIWSIQRYFSFWPLHWSPKGTRTIELYIKQKSFKSISNIWTNGVMFSSLKEISSSWMYVKSDSIK